MSLGEYFRSGSHSRVVRAILGLAGLLALLVARSVPPHFPATPTLQTTAIAAAHDAPLKHDQRPRFDNNESQWSAPVQSFQPSPPVAESPHIASIPGLFCTLQSRGFHYNRPPPAI
jgi:hypothetical protein